MFYVSIFLVGTLCIGVFYWLRNRGRGATPNPVAGWRIPAILIQNMAGLVVAAGTLVIVVLFALLFPTVSKVILDIIGWPLLVAAAITVALAAIFLDGGKRKAVAGGIITLLVIAMIPKLWNSLPSLSGGAAMPAQTVSVCDRVIHQNVPVTKAGRLVNPDPNRCAVAFLVLKGTAKLVGPLIPFGEQRAGDRFGEVKEAMITHIVATSTEETLVNYQLCPASHRQASWC